MTEYYRNQYRSTPSRRVDGPVSMYPTRARRRRLVMLFAALATVVLIVVGSLVGLVWGVKGLIGGGPQQASTANGALTGDTAVASGDTGEAAATGASYGYLGTDYEVKPLVDLTAFRDAAYIPVKGVHVFVAKTRDKASMGRIMDIIDSSELNAMVVAVKEESGRVAYDSQAPMALEYGTAEAAIWGGDLDGLLTTLAERDIIPIARVVCFKDNTLTKKRPDLAIQDKNTGKPWKDYKGDSYLNPYKHEVWEYIVEVSEDIAKRGFREIQFDYVRFPAGQDGDLSTASFPGKYGEKSEAIADFLAYARPRLESLGVWVSADVFGYVVDTGSVKGIGQDLRMMCRNIDLICPMVYPDHYQLGAFGIEYPPAEPYKLIKKAMAKTPGWVAGTGAKCRPWLQAHDDILSRKLDYTPAMVKEEIRAAAELGFDEYLLWGGYPNVGG
jgi:hypothetical protein